MWKAAFTGRSERGESSRDKDGRSNKSEKGDDASTISRRRRSGSDAGTVVSSASRRTDGDREKRRKHESVSYGTAPVSSSKRGLTESAVGALEREEEEWEDEGERRGDRRSKSGKSREGDGRELKRRDSDMVSTSDKKKGKSRAVESSRDGGERGMPAMGSLDQFPGMNAAAIVRPPQMTMPGGMSYDSHVASQFPGQNPATFAASDFLPNPHGEAADYYNDTGESVHRQPGVRASTPMMLHNPDTHLIAPLAVAQPVADTGNGAAAEFFATAGVPASVTAPASASKPSRPSKQSSGSSSGKPPKKPSRTSSLTGAAAALIGGAGIAAAASSHHSESKTTPSSYSAQASTSGGRASQTVPAYSGPPRPSRHNTEPVAAPGGGYYVQPPAVTGRPGKSSPPRADHTGLYAAGGVAAAGMAAYGMSQHQPTTSGMYGAPALPGPRPSMQYSEVRALPESELRHMHEHKGPITRLKDGFLNLLSNPEDVRKMEEYTEYIGVCKYCFDPRSSPYDGPRKHHFHARKRDSFENLRRRSAERLRRRTSSERVDKENRYYAGRKSTSKTDLLAGGLAAAGVATAAGAMFNDSKTFDDTYSVKSGYRAGSLRRRGSSSSRERRGGEHGVISADRREEWVTVRTKDGKLERRRRRRSRSHSGNRESTMMGAVAGAALGAGAIAAASGQRRDSSPERVFVRHGEKHRSRSRSNSPGLGQIFGFSGSASKRRSPDRRRPDRVQESTGILGGFFSPSSGKSRKVESGKKAKSTGFFSFSNGSSSSSDGGLAFGAEGMASRSSLGRRSSRSSLGRTASNRNGKRPVRKTSDERMNAAMLGIGATAAALAVAQNRQRVGKKQSRPDLGGRRDVRQRPGLGGSRVSSRPVEDEEWEDESPSSDDGMSGLAFGDDDAVRSRLSRQSMESVGSKSSDGGLSAWGWRWGGKGKKRRKDSMPNDDPYASTTGAGVLGAATMAGTAYDARDRPSLPQSSHNSSASIPQTPLQYVDPRPLSDNNGSRHASMPGAFDAGLTSFDRPGPGPLQQPQPIFPVQPSFTRPEYDGSMTSTSGPRRSMTEPTRQAPTSSFMQDAAVIGGTAALVGAGVIAAQGLSSSRDRDRGKGSVSFGFTEEQQRKADEEARSERKKEEESRRRADRVRAVKEEAERVSREEDARAQAEIRRRDEERQLQDARDREEQERRKRDEDRRRTEARERREQEELEVQRKESERREEAYRREQARLQAEERARSEAAEAAREERDVVAQREQEERQQVEIRKRERREVEERECARREVEERERTRRERESRERETADSQRRDREVPQEREREQTQSNKSAWHSAAAAGIAGALVGSVAAGALHKHVDSDDEQDQYRSRDAPASKPAYIAQTITPSNEHSGAPITDDDLIDPDLFKRRRAQSDLTRQADIARKAAEKVIADREEYYNAPETSQRDFFMPKELLDREPEGKERVAGPLGDNDVHVYNAVEDVPSWGPAWGARGVASEAMKRSNIPMLNVIAPTPPHSTAGSVRGDRSMPSSPLVQAQDDEHHEDDTTRPTNGARGVSWGEDKTHIYEVRTPDSYQEPAGGDYVSAGAYRTSGSSHDDEYRHVDPGHDEIVVETEEPTGSTKRTTYGAEDLPKAAPNVFDFLVRDKQQTPGTEGAPPVRGWVEGETEEPTPREEKVMHVPGGFDDVAPAAVLEEGEEAWAAPVGKKDKKKKRDKSGKAGGSEPGTPAQDSKTRQIDLGQSTADYFGAGTSERNEPEPDEQLARKVADSFEPATSGTAQAEPEDAWEAPLSKKEQKKRDKERLARETAAFDDPAISGAVLEDPAVLPETPSAAREERDEVAWEPPLSKKEQKKRDKERVAREAAAVDEAEDQRQRAAEQAFPPAMSQSASRDLEPETEPAWEAPLSKKEQKKRDKERLAREAFAVDEPVPSSSTRDDADLDDFTRPREDPEPAAEPAWEPPLSKKELKKREKAAKDGIDSGPSTPALERSTSVYSAADEFATPLEESSAWEPPLSKKELKKREKAAKSGAFADESEPTTPAAERELDSRPVDELATPADDTAWEPPLSKKEQKKREKDAKKSGGLDIGTSVVVAAGLAAAVDALAKQSDDVEAEWSSSKKDKKSKKKKLGESFDVDPRDSGSATPTAEDMPGGWQESSSDATRDVSPVKTEATDDFAAFETKKGKNKKNRDSGRFGEVAASSPLRSEVAFDDYIGARGANDRAMPNVTERAIAANGTDQDEEYTNGHSTDRNGNAGDYFGSVAPVSESPRNLSPKDEPPQSVASSPSDERRRSKSSKSGRDRDEYADEPYGYDDARSVAASESTSNGSRSKHRSRTHDDDDAVSTISSRSKKDKSESSSTKKEKKGGILGLFSRKQSDPAPAPLSRTSTRESRDSRESAENDDSGHRRHRRRRTGSEYGDDDDDTRSVATTSSHRHRDKDGDSDRESRRDDDGGGGERHKHRRHRSERETEEDQSFLDMRVEDLPPLPASRPASPVAASPERREESKSEGSSGFAVGGDDAEIGSRSLNELEMVDVSPAIDQQTDAAVLTALPASRPESPVHISVDSRSDRETLDNLPSLPASRPESPTEFMPRPTAAGRMASTTAVPLRFRQPPFSPAQPRERSSSFDASAPSTPMSPDSSQKSKAIRPRSSEFRNSSEFRPLYLVSRNSKIEDIEEQLPSLPSSKPSSRASSVQGSDEWHSAAESVTNSPVATKRALTIDAGSANRYSPEEDILGSAHSTPKASTFSTGVSDVQVPKQEPQFYTWDDFQRDERLHDEAARVEEGGVEGFDLTRPPFSQADAEEAYETERQVSPSRMSKSEKRKYKGLAAAAMVGGVAGALVARDRDSSAERDVPRSRDDAGKASSLDKDASVDFPVASGVTTSARELDPQGSSFDELAPVVDEDKWAAPVTSKKKGKKGKKGKVLDLSTFTAPDPVAELLPVPVHDSEDFTGNATNLPDDDEEPILRAPVQSASSKKKGKKSSRSTIDEAASASTPTPAAPSEPARRAEPALNAEPEESFEDWFGPPSAKSIDATKTFSWEVAQDENKPFESAEQNEFQGAGRDGFMDADQPTVQPDMTGPTSDLELRNVSDDRFEAPREMEDLNQLADPVLPSSDNEDNRLPSAEDVATGMHDAVETSKPGPSATRQVTDDVNPTSLITADASDIVESAPLLTRKQSKKSKKKGKSVFNFEPEDDSAAKQDANVPPVDDRSMAAGTGLMSHGEEPHAPPQDNDLGQALLPNDQTQLAKAPELDVAVDDDSSFAPVTKNKKGKKGKKQKVDMWASDEPTAPSEDSPQPIETAPAEPYDSAAPELALAAPKEATHDHEPERETEAVHQADVQVPDLPSVHDGKPTTNREAEASMDAASLSTAVVKTSPDLSISAATVDDDNEQVRQVEAEATQPKSTSKSWFSWPWGGSDPAKPTAVVSTPHVAETLVSQDTAVSHDIAVPHEEQASRKLEEVLAETVPLPDSPRVTPSDAKGKRKSRNSSSGKASRPSLESRYLSRPEIYIQDTPTEPEVEGVEGEHSAALNTLQPSDDAFRIDAAHDIFDTAAGSVPLPESPPHSATNFDEAMPQDDVTLDRDANADIDVARNLDETAAAGTAFAPAEDTTGLPEETKPTPATQNPAETDVFTESATADDDLWGVAKVSKKGKKGKKSKKSLASTFDESTNNREEPYETIDTAGPAFRDAPQPQDGRADETQQGPLDSSGLSEHAERATEPWPRSPADEPWAPTLTKKKGKKRTKQAEPLFDTEPSTQELEPNTGLLSLGDDRDASMDNVGDAALIALPDSDTEDASQLIGAAVDAKSADEGVSAIPDASRQSTDPQALVERLAEDLQLSTNANDPDTSALEDVWAPPEKRKKGKKTKAVLSSGTTVPQRDAPEDEQAGEAQGSDEAMMTEVTNNTESAPPTPAESDDPWALPAKSKKGKKGKKARFDFVDVAPDRPEAENLVEQQGTSAEPGLSDTMESSRALPKTPGALAEDDASWAVPLKGKKGKKAKKAAMVWADEDPETMSLGTPGDDAAKDSLDHVQLAPVTQSLEVDEAAVEHFERDEQDPEVRSPDTVEVDRSLPREVGDGPTITTSTALGTGASRSVSDAGLSQETEPTQRLDGAESLSQADPQPSSTAEVAFSTGLTHEIADYQKDPVGHVSARTEVQYLEQDSTLPLFESVAPASPATDADDAATKFSDRAAVQITDDPLPDVADEQYAISTKSSKKDKRKKRNTWDEDVAPIEASSESNDVTTVLAGVIDVMPTAMDTESSSIGANDDLTGSRGFVESAAAETDSAFAPVGKVKKSKKKGNKTPVWDEAPESVDAASDLPSLESANMPDATAVVQDAPMESAQDEPAGVSVESVAEDADALPEWTAPVKKTKKDKKKGKQAVAWEDDPVETATPVSGSQTPAEASVETTRTAELVPDETAAPAAQELDRSLEATEPPEEWTPTSKKSKKDKKKGKLAMFWGDEPEDAVTPASGSQTPVEVAHGSDRVAETESTVPAVAGIDKLDGIGEAAEPLEWAPASKKSKKDKKKGRQAASWGDEPEKDPETPAEAIDEAYQVAETEITTSAVAAPDKLDGSKEIAEPLEEWAPAPKKSKKDKKGKKAVSWEAEPENDPETPVEVLDEVDRAGETAGPVPAVVAPADNPNGSEEVAELVEEWAPASKKGKKDKRKGKKAISWDDDNLDIRDAVTETALDNTAMLPDEPLQTTGAELSAADIFHEVDIDAVNDRQLDRADVSEPVVSASAKKPKKGKKGRKAMAWEDETSTVDSEPALVDATVADTGAHASRGALEAADEPAAMTLDDLRSADETVGSRHDHVDENEYQDMTGDPDTSPHPQDLRSLEVTEPSLDTTDAGKAQDAQLPYTSDTGLGHPTHPVWNDNPSASASSPSGSQAAMAGSEVKSTIQPEQSSAVEEIWDALPKKSSKKEKRRAQKAESAGVDVPVLVASDLRSHGQGAVEYTPGPAADVLEHDRDINFEIAQGISASVKQEGGSELADTGSVRGTDVPQPAHGGDDIDFAATLAAGLSNSGFDPNVVIDNPTYHRRASPPVQVAEADPEEFFSTVQKNKKGKGKKSQPAAEQQGTEVQAPTDDFESLLAQGLQDSGFDSSLLQGTDPAGDITARSAGSYDADFAYPLSKGKKSKRAKAAVSAMVTDREITTHETTDREMTEHEASAVEVDEAVHRVLGNEAGNLVASGDKVEEDVWAMSTKKSKKGKKRGAVQEDASTFEPESSSTGLDAHPEALVPNSEPITSPTTPDGARRNKVEEPAPNSQDEPTVPDDLGITVPLVYAAPESAAAAADLDPFHMTERSLEGSQLQTVQQAAPEDTMEADSFQMSSKKKGKKGKKRAVNFEDIDNPDRDTPEPLSTTDTAEASANDASDPAATHIIGGVGEQDVDDMDNAYKAYKKNKRKQKKLQAVAVAGASAAKAAETPTESAGERELETSNETTPLPSTVDPVDWNTASPPAPTEPMSQTGKRIKASATTRGTPPTSPTSLVESVFPGLKRVKRRTASIHSPDAESTRSGVLLHTSEVSQFVPTTVEKQPSPQSNAYEASTPIDDSPQRFIGQSSPDTVSRPRNVRFGDTMDSPTARNRRAVDTANISATDGDRQERSDLASDDNIDKQSHHQPLAEPSWSFAGLAAPADDSSRSAPDTNGPNTVIRDSGYHEAVSPGTKRHSDGEGSRGLPTIKSSTSRDSLRSRRSAEPLHIDTATTTDWALNVPRQRSEDKDTTDAQRRARSDETPLESTSRNRASYLFQSPPPNLAETTRSPASSNTGEASNIADYFKHRSIDSVASSDAAESLRAATGPLSPRSPLDTIAEEPHARKRSLAESNIAVTPSDHGGKALRRTETPRGARVRTLSPLPARDETGPRSIGMSLNDTEAYSNAPPTDGKSKRTPSDARSASVLSNRSNVSATQHRTPEDRHSISRASNRSSTPILRRVNLSGDLRAASRASNRLGENGSGVGVRASPNTIPFEPPPTPPLNDEDDYIDGASRAAGMADVFQGYGDGHGSQASPTRPPSMRKRQSMHIMELESQLDHLTSENRSLQEARSRGLDSDAMEGVTGDASMQLREKDNEIQHMNAMLGPLQQEIERLAQINADLTESNRNLVDGANGRFATLESEHAETRQQWESSARELEQARQENHRLTSGMRDAIAAQLGSALADKDHEIRKLREDLEIATERIRALQVQIQSSRASDYLVSRDEDYFDGACQKLCQHVQQWVLRFSKASDNRICRISSDIRDEKIETRLDNALLDGSDVDKLLGDRVKRRDVFMSVVMTMVWEYVFTRYLFGMDREQRQKLKALEKVLAEVGPARAVAQWRATTLTLLSKRPSFAGQCKLDTEAVAHEIFGLLCALLPPPSNTEQQLLTSLQKVIGVAVDLSIEMRVQRSEYIMLPPLQPEYDTNGDLVRKVNFNASLMNERSGAFPSMEALESEHAIVKIVLFPLVVKKGDELGEGEEEIVVCPAQVLVHNDGGKGKKVVRVMSGAMEIDDPRRSRQSLFSEAPGSTQAY